MTPKELGMRSLRGVWVGDCIGNMSELYNIHDILNALEKGIQQYGGLLPIHQFSFSDDTEEAIVIYNHYAKAFDDAEKSDQYKQELSRLKSEPENSRFTEWELHQFALTSCFSTITNLDNLAMELAKRYTERDTDGEKYGYGLMTRKVLRAIADGIPWWEANKTYLKSEGTSSHVDDLVDSILDKKPWRVTANKVMQKLEKEKAEKKQSSQEKVGSCGNGAAMRIAPLGALLAPIYHGDEECWSSCEVLVYPEKVVAEEASKSALPTHDHPEGIAGAMAIATLAHLVADARNRFPDAFKNQRHYVDIYFQEVLRRIPDSKVKEGIVKVRSMSFDTPFMDVIKAVGNGSHVTCQDTVPLCCWLAIRALGTYSYEEMYEKAIMDTTSCQGDVDTNCAIVGGIVGIVSDPPEKWIRLCKPMEGVYEF